jgi:hypothetical protein
MEVEDGGGSSNGDIYGGGWVVDERLRKRTMAVCGA